MVKVGSKQKPAELCNPLETVRLLFSSPVILEEVKKLTYNPDLAGGRKDYDPWQDVYSYSDLSSPHRKDRYYNVGLPQGLKAFHQYRIKGSLRDEFNRELPTPIDFSFKTNHRPRNFVRKYFQSVLETGIDNDVPIYVTNLDAVNLQYQSLRNSGFSRGTHSIKLKNLTDISYGVPAGIKKILGGKEGMVYATVSTKPGIQTHKSDRDYIITSQVSSLGVHTKIGHYNTLVWVTDLATGKNVDDAKVQIVKSGCYRSLYDLKSLSKAKTITQGSTNEAGIAMLKGTEALDPKLVLFRSHDCMFLKVKKGKQLAILPMDHPYYVDSDNASSVPHSYLRKKHGHIKMWGMTRRYRG